MGQSQQVRLSEIARSIGCQYNYLYYRVIRGEAPVHYQRVYTEKEAASIKEWFTKKYPHMLLVAADAK